MLLPYLKTLNNKIVILGSQSKSRNELMAAQRIQYQVFPSQFKEDLDKGQYIGNPAQYNQDTCSGKVEDLLQRFKENKIDWDVLICGDTILEFNGEIIEKPEDQQHCIKMMGALANSTHRVYTAHTVVFNPEKYPKKYRKDWYSRAQVTFGEIPLNVLEHFAKEAEPYRHSGGYELTAMSGSFLKSINGSHSAVQGLNMHEVCLQIIEGGKQLEWWA